MLKSQADQPPFVSLIMPVRNEQAWIGLSLSAALSQDYPSDRLEVLIADGLSTDNTRRLADQVAAKDSRVRLIDNPARTMAVGFNRALDLARGEVIVMLGGHTELAPDYVRNCVLILQGGFAECVGGPIETMGADGKRDAISLALSSRFGVGGARFRTGVTEKMYVDTVAFGAYRRDAIASAGRLDEELVRNQDDEYNYRLRKLGGRILLAPTVRSRYHCRRSRRALWQQYFQYGCWKVRILQKHPRQMRPRQFAPPLVLGSLLTSAVMAPFSKGARGSMGLIIASYMLANLGASLAVARSNDWRILPNLPASFATLHMAYGLGFLFGMLKFSRAWISD